MSFASFTKARARSPVWVYSFRAYRKDAPNDAVWGNGEARFADLYSAIRKRVKVSIKTFRSL